MSDVAERLARFLAGSPVLDLEDPIPAPIVNEHTAKTETTVIKSWICFWREIVKNTPSFKFADNEEFFSVSAVSRVTGKHIYHWIRLYISAQYECGTGLSLETIRTYCWALKRVVDKIHVEKGEESLDNDSWETLVLKAINNLVQHNSAAIAASLRRSGVTNPEDHSHAKPCGKAGVSLLIAYFVKFRGDLPMAVALSIACHTGWRAHSMVSLRLRDLEIVVSNGTVTINCHCHTFKAEGHYSPHMVTLETVALADFVECLRRAPTMRISLPEYKLENAEGAMVDAMVPKYVLVIFMLYRRGIKLLNAEGNGINEEALIDLKGDATPLLPKLGDPQAAITEDSFSLNIASASDAVGLPHYTSHSLRQGFVHWRLYLELYKQAKVYLTTGKWVCFDTVALYKILELAGWAKESNALKHYLHQMAIIAVYFGVPSDALAHFARIKALFDIDSDGKGGKLELKPMDAYLGGFFDMSRAFGDLKGSRRNSPSTSVYERAGKAHNLEIREKLKFGLSSEQIASVSMHGRKLKDLLKISERDFVMRCGHGSPDLNIKPLDYFGCEEEMENLLNSPEKKGAFIVMCDQAMARFKNIRVFPSVQRNHDQMEAQHKAKKFLAGEVSLQRGVVDSTRQFKYKWTGESELRLVAYISENGYLGRRVSHLWFERLQLAIEPSHPALITSWGARDKFKGLYKSYIGVLPSDWATLIKKPIAQELYQKMVSRRNDELASIHEAVVEQEARNDVTATRGAGAKVAAVLSSLGVKRQAPLKSGSSGQRAKRKPRKPFNEAEIKDCLKFMLIRYKEVLREGESDMPNNLVASDMCNVTDANGVKTWEGARLSTGRGVYEWGKNSRGKAEVIKIKEQAARELAKE